MSRYYDADGADRRITTINQYLDVYPDVDDFGVPYEDANVEDGQPSGAHGHAPSSPTPDPSPRRGARVPSSPRASGGDSGPATHSDVDDAPAGSSGRGA